MALRIGKIALTGFVAGALLSATALAAPQSKPNGPWITDSQNVSLAGLRSYEQLWHTLEQIERSAKGNVTLGSAPRVTNTGREIPVVTIGSGPRSIMIIAQQHGNEYVVSEAMVELVRSLSSNSKQARQIRDAVTLTVVPRVNVDGFDAIIEDADGNTPPWRQNYDPFCVTDECPAFYRQGRGYDINRYHSFLELFPETDPYVGGPNPVPESVAMRLLFDERQPSVVIDFHHQGSYVDAEGDLITGSTLWPNATAAAADLGVEDKFDPAVILAKKVVTVMALELDPYGYANLTLYPGTTTPGIARNAYGLLGAGSVLFEMRGGIGVKSNGYITKTAYNAAKSVVAAMADGSLYDADISVAENLPPRGPGISAPNEEEEGE
ncbi:M14 family zinc carboxypeptidase [Marinobacter sp.]|uniref:M14 family zinc carboxypeptidase n=1 Tax=Marinobacter sp. TaxID=50741 RepID=UPI003A945F7C